MSAPFETPVLACDQHTADVTLIELGQEYVAAEAEMERIDAESDRLARSSDVRRSLNERSDALNERTGDIAEQAANLPASTMEGIAAKVMMVRSSIPFAARSLTAVGSTHHELVWSIVRDLDRMQS